MDPNHPRLYGLLLFVLFINDVTILFRKGTTCKLYAYDDLKLYSDIETNVGNCNAKWTRLAVRFLRKYSVLHCLNLGAKLVMSDIALPLSKAVMDLGLLIHIQ